MTEHRKALESGLETAGIHLDVSAVTRLVLFLLDLEKWNRSYNLTAVRTIEDMIPRHVLESLALLPWLEGNRIIDVGSGAGLPGIPVAIADTERSLTLLDSNGKKTRFLRHVVRSLGLDNVSVVQERVEEFEPDDRYDAVLSRAFAPPERLLAGVSRFLGAGGKVFAMIGKIEPPPEAGPDWNWVATEAMNSPGQTAERHLMIFERL